MWFNSSAGDETCRLRVPSLGQPSCAEACSWFARDGQPDANGACHACKTLAVESACKTAGSMAYKHTLNKQHTLSIMEKQGHVNTDHILKVVEIRVHLSANGKVMPNVSNA